MISLEFKDQKVVIRGPEWNDSHTVNTGLNLKRAMDGSVRTYLKKATHTKQFSLAHENRAKATEILNFLLASAGQPIKATELYHKKLDNELLKEDVVWYGIVTTSIESIHQAVRNSSQVFTFEGVRSASERY